MQPDHTSRPTDRSAGGTEPELSSAAWQARYQSGNTGWDRGLPSPMLSRWIGEGTLEPCRILVPGCGRGHEVLALAEAGFEVTAVDFADEAIASLTHQLSRHGLAANVVQADLFAFESTDTFDAVYEQTCLCAIHPSRWRTYEQRLTRWLRPGGQLFAMFMQRDQPGGPPFNCDLGSMRDLFRPANWAWLTEPQRVEHPTGMHELACVLQRQETES